MRKNRKFVRDFEDSTIADINLIGRKGAGLSEMTRLGLPVPPGFTITTTSAKLIEEQGFKAIEKEVYKAVKRLEIKTGKKFGDSKKPLLVSVRSGATISMPGIMETILNVGLNSEIVEANNSEFFYKCYHKLITSFGNNIFGIDHFNPSDRDFHCWTDHGYQKGVEDVLKYIKEIDRYFPQSPKEQLEMAIKAVFSSWNSKKAQKFKALENILNDQGTAVNVQTMVFGNLNEKSLTATYFTRDPGTGEKKLFGSFIIQEQGDSLVGGDKSRPLSEMQPEMLKQLTDLGTTLENRFKDMQEIEVTVESGKPYLLQTRTGKRTTRAGLRILLDQIEAGKLNEREALLKVNPESLRNIRKKIIDPKERYSVAAKGTGVSPGIVTGYVAYDQDGINHIKRKGGNPILVTSKLETDDVQLIYDCSGIITAKSEGNTVSHALVVARGKNKPCVSGVNELILTYNGWILNGKLLLINSPITINGDTGEVIKQLVNLVEVDADAELKEISRIADKYAPKSLIIPNSLEGVARIGPEQGVLYLPSSLMKNQADLRQALYGNKKSLRKIENDFFKEYLQAIQTLQNHSPLVIGLTSRETLSEFTGNKERQQFRKLFLEESLALEQTIKPEEKKSTQLVVGAKILYFGKSAKVYKICPGCGIKLVYETGSMSCIKSSEVSQLEFKGEYTFKKELEKTKRELENQNILNPEKVWNLQIEAADRAIKKAGNADVRIIEYSPAQTMVQLGKTRYNIFHQSNLEVERLISAQEAIRNGS